MGIVVNLLSAFWAVYVLEQKVAGLAMELFGRQYRGADAFYMGTFIMVFLVLIWSLALLGVILCLSQQETKALFGSGAAVGARSNAVADPNHSAE